MKNKSEEGLPKGDLTFDGGSVPYAEDAVGQASTAQTTAIVLANTTDNGEKKKKGSSISSVLGGSEKVLRRNWAVIALVIVLSLVYTSNRYMADQELIKISDLQRELNETRYRALTHSCDLTTQCRQSLIEERLRQAGDTAMHVTKAPFRVVRKK